MTMGSPPQRRSQNWAWKGRSPGAPTFAHQAINRERGSVSETSCKALLFESIHPRAIELLRTVAEVHIAERLDDDYLIDAARDADALIVRARAGVKKRLIEAASRLKVIGRHGVGVDHIDLEEARRRRIYVVNTPDANTESVAEHCIGMMIMLCKQLYVAGLAVRQGDWEARNIYIGRELREKTIGLVGFGRIGQRVAEIAHRGLAMSVLYYDVVADPDRESSCGARRVSLEELLATADIVSLHVPLVSSTRCLIGERELATMKPSSYLINTARGSVVDEDALCKALQEGQIAGAGLDVFELEPPARSHPLWALENVVASPHMAAHTEEAMLRMAMVVEDVVLVLRGESPKHWVNRWE